MRRLLRASAAACLVSFAGCSFWVSSEPEQVGCMQEGKVGPPACDMGFICAHESCVRCAARELCGDSVDNDCNGRVDDGCSNVSGGGGSAGRGLQSGGAAGMAKPAGVESGAGEPG
jgi:hypothetical protein